MFACLRVQYYTVSKLKKNCRREKGLYVHQYNKYMPFLLRPIHESKFCCLLTLWRYYSSNLVRVFSLSCRNLEPIFIWCALILYLYPLLWTTVIQSFYYFGERQINRFLNFHLIFFQFLAVHVILCFVLFSFLLVPLYV